MLLHFPVSKIMVYLPYIKNILRCINVPKLHCLTRVRQIDIIDEMDRPAPLSPPFNHHFWASSSLLFFRFFIFFVQFTFLSFSLFFLFGRFFQILFFFLFLLWYFSNFLFFSFFVIFWLTIFLVQLSSWLCFFSALLA